MTSDTARIRNGKGKAAYKRKRNRLKREVEANNLPCWICLHPIDTKLPPTDRMSFTADHYLALNRGGHLVRNELRPAHRSCNSRRGDTADVEIWGAS